MKELHASYISSAAWSAIQDNLLPDEIDWKDVVRRLSHFVIDQDLEVSRDPDPLVSMLANLLCRGLPTLPSLYIERKLERLTALVACRPFGSEGVSAYRGKFDCERMDDFFRLLGRAYCPTAPGAFLAPSPGYGFPDFGSGEDDTRFDSEAEKNFWEGPLRDALGPGGIQLALRQRSLSSIAGEDFKGQRVDIAVEIPGSKFGIAPKGIVFEVDGPHHQYSQVVDRKRDEGCRKAGWAATYRRKLWRNESASNAIETSHGGVSWALSNPYFRYANENVTNPLTSDDLGARARIVALFPLAVARIQRVIIELILSGNLSLNSPIWTIAVLDRDGLGGPGKAACVDLRIWMRKLWRIFSPSAPIPIIRVLEFSDDCPDSIGDHQIDVFIDVSIELRYGATYPDPALPTNITSARRVVVRTGYYPHQRLRELFFGAPLVLQADGKLLEDSLTFVLRSVFRKVNFRPKQIEIIKRALRNESVIALLPTGAGKSITYQIPALLQNGIVIVVDPIKSLMKDQDDNLKSLAISSSTFINSMTTSRERRLNTRLLQSGVFKFVFISPERFIIREFREALEKMKADGKVYCAYTVVDEAHCVSEWGHDFRTAYLRLGANARRFCPTRVDRLPLLALTGTASFEVLEDVRVELGHDRFGGDIDVRPDNMERKNLNYRVVVLELPSAPPINFTDMKAKELVGDAKLRIVKKVVNDVSKALGHEGFENFIKNNAGSGLIFCPHARWKHGAQDVRNSLSDGFPEIAESIGLYYGSAEETGRDSHFDPVRTQDEFKQGKLKVLACTKAFGMGIDKPDVRFTLHYNIPPSLESFYQEAGRSGRDGEESQCWVMYSPTINPAYPERTVDNSINYSFHKSTFPGVEIETERLFEILGTNRIPAQSPSHQLSDFLFDETGIDYIAKPYHPDQSNIFRVYINHPDYQQSKVFIEFLVNGKAVARVTNGFPGAQKIADVSLMWLQWGKPESVGWHEWIFSKGETRCEPGIEIIIERLHGCDKQPMVIHFENDLLETVSEYLKLNELDVRRSFQYAISAEKFVADLSRMRRLEADEIQRINEIFPKIRLREHTFRAIYRLTLLGVVEDFEADYAAGTMTIWVGAQPPGGYTKSLENYIRSHAPRDVEAYLETVEDDAAVLSELRRCARVLIEFVYNRIAKQRLTALQYMEQTTQQGISDPNAFKEQVTNFFDSSYLPHLRAHLNIYSKELVFEIWSDTGGLPSKMSHLLGACNRLLPENPDNGAFHALRGFATALLGYPEKSVLQEFEAAIECFSRHEKWTRQDAHHFLLQSRRELISVDSTKAGLLDALLIRDHALWVSSFVKNAKRAISSAPSLIESDA